MFLSRESITVRWLQLAVAWTTVFVAHSACANPAADFQLLLDEAWEWQLDENPVWASMLGDRRGNKRWNDDSLQAIERRVQEREVYLQRLEAIDSSALSDQDQLNYALFGREIRSEIEENQYRAFLMPLNQLGGVQSLDTIAQSLPFSTLQDYEDWLLRLAGIDKVIEQTIVLLETGRQEGLVPAKVVMERIPQQIAVQLVEDAQDSPFYKVFTNLPGSFTAPEQKRLTDSAKAVIAEKVVPAYRRFNQYFIGTYLPASRDNIAASSLPNGKAFYAFQVRQFTTTQLSPDEIHRLGLQEVKRIRAAMQSVLDELEFAGSFADFLHFLRTDSQFYYADPQELFDGYLAICKRIDPEVVKLFGKLPRHPYGVRAIPDSIAPDSPTAYYSQPAADGTRAGYFYVNLHKPESRPKYEMEVLSVHESVPGHHLQIALQMELADMPNFRRYSGYTAFIEGWGLYSEGLGYDLGLYKDPYSRFGALTYEMWRAVRLVVDTGMHSQGWTRQQAIDCFKEIAAKTELDIINEIDRYIAWPGQALAYKIGQLKILELRDNAEQALGDNFDIRAFHDEMLGAGALPLERLETRMNRWLVEQMQSVKEQ